MEQIQIGSQDRSILVFIPDPASTDGSGKTGLNAAALTVSYTRMETDNDAVVTDVTSSLNDLAALTTAHTEWGVKEISSTLAPGLYRLDVADDVFVTGAWYAVVYVMITSSAAAATPKAFRLVVAELDAISGRLPASLVSGRIDASVGAMVANTVTASALATDAVNEIAAAVSASGAPNLLVTTLIAALTDQTHFTLTAGSTDDHAYVQCGVVIQDAVTAAQKAVGVVSAYDGATRGVTLLHDPEIFTMAVGDTVSIISVPEAGLLLDRLTVSRANAMDNLPDIDLPISSRASQSTVDGIHAKTVNLTFTIAGKVDAAIVDAASFAQAAADKVWATTVRTLTAGTNIVLTKGTGLLGLNDVSVGDIWTASTRTLTSFGTLVADMWTYPSRTLTNLGTLATDVWTAGTRTLTSFGTLPADVWTSGTRTLTSFGTLAASVWAHGTRTLTSVDVVAADIWAYATRTLTSHGTLVSDIWTAGTRTLTSGGAIAGDVWAVILENGKSAAHFMRIFKSVLSNTSEGAESGIYRYRDDANQKDRLVMVTDANENRTSRTSEDGT